MEKYGQHGDLVVSFLDEVAHQDLATWQAISDGPLDVTKDTVAATDAITKADIPEGVRRAVADLGTQAYAQLDLDPGDFPGPLQRGLIAIRINSAVFAIAGGSALERAHREILLRPFADHGFTSAAEALERVP
ncbi:hypothetical protein [Cellulomonas denverensis]|uniref:Uncharacterized protein n=1 Tax=Cellulomonas denverensis TaxID=264297 RepID=A0A7X6R0Y3_9CELL|nr:hypothetical protein [Cellulomonas denverensis]NKY24611.1 hypothetical protein [Cellulomonas denverensis]GIG25697.1 hypothetical protein Cde04nite_19410 [Cellulomonas denverensis]